MNADDIRNLYTYHFTLNRKLWDESIITLSNVQFKHKLTYSVGSIRNQMGHMMNVDDRWFQGCGVKIFLILPIHSSTIHARKFVRNGMMSR